MMKPASLIRKAWSCRRLLNPLVLPEGTQVAHHARCCSLRDVRAVHANTS